MDFITTLVAVPAILAIVNLFKRYGLNERWAPVLSIVLGGALGALASFLQLGVPTPENIIFGVITGFSASGLYDVAATVGSPVKVEVEGYVPRYAYDENDPRRALED